MGIENQRPFWPRRSRGPTVGLLFDEGDFVVGEAVELIDELVDLVVGGGDLPLQHRPGMPR